MYYFTRLDANDAPNQPPGATDVVADVYVLVGWSITVSRPTVAAVASALHPAVVADANCS